MQGGINYENKTAIHIFQHNTHRHAKNKQSLNSPLINYVQKRDSSRGASTIYPTEQLTRAKSRLPLLIFIY